MITDATLARASRLLDCPVYPRLRQALHLAAADGIDVAIEAIRVREPIHLASCPCATCVDRRGIIEDLRLLAEGERR